MQDMVLDKHAGACAARQANADRFVSVDALRGFDMFWIVGGGAVVQALHGVCGDRFTGFLSKQMDHSKWQGFTFEDLILPLFLFLVGVSLVFSLGKLMEKQGRRPTLIRIFRRTLLLFFLGIVFYGGFRDGWQDVRWFGGVLQRIALAYCVTGLLFCFCRPRTLATVTAGLLLGYWAVLMLVPMRDIRLDDAAFQRLSHATGLHDERQIFRTVTATVTGRLEPGYNVSHHLDFLYLPGQQAYGRYESQTILGSAVSIASSLAGVFAGLLLISPNRTKRQKVAWLLGAGATAAAVGFLWSFTLPLITRLSTPSFVLMAAGYSAILMGVFYGVVDVCGWRRWCEPFVWIGMNAITIYILWCGVAIVNFNDLAARLVGGPIAKLLDSILAEGAGALAIRVVALGLGLLLMRFLYRRQVFLRV
jgi:predicted acyltransferase